MTINIQRTIHLTLAVFLLLSYGTSNFGPVVGSHKPGNENIVGVVESPESALFSTSLRLSAGDAKPQTITGLDLFLSVVSHGAAACSDPNGEVLLLYLDHATGISPGLEQTDIIYPFHYFL